MREDIKNKNMIKLYLNLLINSMTENIFIPKKIYQSCRPSVAPSSFLWSLFALRILMPFSLNGFSLLAPSFCSHHEKTSMPQSLKLNDNLDRIYFYFTI